MFAGSVGILDVDNGDPSTDAEPKVFLGANRTHPTHEPLAIAVTNNVCGPERVDCRQFLTNNGAHLLDDGVTTRRAIWLRGQ